MEYLRHNLSFLYENLPEKLRLKIYKAKHVRKNKC